MSLELIWIWKLILNLISPQNFSATLVLSAIASTKRKQRTLTLIPYFTIFWARTKIRRKTILKKFVSHVWQARKINSDSTLTNNWVWTHMYIILWASATWFLTDSVWETWVRYDSLIPMNPNVSLHLSGRPPPLLWCVFSFSNYLCGFYLSGVITMNWKAGTQNRPCDFISSTNQNL